MAEEEPKTTEADKNIMALKGIQTLFGDVQGEKIVFCIDTSGSTYEILPTIKEHLTETLVRMAYQSEKRQFNIVQFNSKIKQWSDSMVPCTPETVYLAVKWIREFQSTSGSNLLDALLCAFENDCDVVYVVSDSCPDQDNDRILDHIAYISKGRPVNCVYVTKGAPDKAAWEFYDELASDTFGTFHVVNISRHGCLERVTPIHKQNFPTRVIRTNEGSVYPNLSNCSVTSCLTGDPLKDPVFVAPNTVVNPVTGQTHPYYHPYNHMYWWGAPVPGAFGPYAPYGPHMYHPFYSWSRYKASRAFIYGKEKLKDAQDDPNLCPTAAALLIGRKVLARMVDDGLYYEGKVKSEYVDRRSTTSRESRSQSVVQRWRESVLSNQRSSIYSDSQEILPRNVIPTSTDSTYGRRFLVEFSPHKGKKFDDTTYQDTSLADIVAFDDAFRHPILPGDRVLFPEKVENPTKYLLGTVMEGSEPRAGKEEAPSESLVVSLVDGNMSTVPQGVAIWIPNGMFNRVSLEMKMPAKERERLHSTPGYPFISLPGYPTNEMERTPAEFERIQPAYRRGVDLQVDHMLPPFYMPVCPTYERYGRLAEIGCVDEKERTVPGTEMTSSELQEKVDSQLRNHERLFLKNSAEKNCSRQVSFSDEVKEAIEAEVKEKAIQDESIFEKDSGCDPDLSWEQLHDLKSDSGKYDLDLEDLDIPIPPYRRIRPKSAEGKPRPPWRHFGKDTIPEMLDRKEQEPYMVRGTSCMETRPMKHIGGAVEWPASSFASADPHARTIYDRELLLSQLARRPASAAHRPSPDFSAPPERDSWRRERVLCREEARQARILDQMQLEEKAARWRRDRASEQLERLGERQRREEEALERQRENKRRVVASLAARTGSGGEEAERAVKKVEMIRQRREERESALKSLDERVSNNRRRLEDLHRQRDAARWESAHSRLQAEERRMDAQDLVAREVERNRRAIHRHQEEVNQRQLEMKAYAAKQKAPPLA